MEYGAIDLHTKRKSDADRDGDGRGGPRADGSRRRAIGLRGVWRAGADAGAARERDGERVGGAARWRASATRWWWRTPITRRCMGADAADEDGPARCGGAGRGESAGDLSSGASGLGGATARCGGAAGARAVGADADAGDQCDASAVAQDGYRLPTGSAETVAARFARMALPAALVDTVTPLLTLLDALAPLLRRATGGGSARGGRSGRRRLMTAPGVGPITAAALSRHAR